jgi:hypothetical protein
MSNKSTNLLCCTIVFGALLCGRSLPVEASIADYFSAFSSDDHFLATCSNGIHLAVYRVSQSYASALGGDAQHPTCLDFMEKTRKIPLSLFKLSLRRAHFFR